MYNKSVFPPKQGSIIYLWSPFRIDFLLWCGGMQTTSYHKYASIFQPPPPFG